MSDQVTLDRKVVIAVFEPLRLAWIYALKDSHPEELGEDFKPWKWEDSEIEYAQNASAVYRRLLDAMTEAEVEAVTRQSYMVVRCQSCKVQVTWDRRTRFSFGWFHGTPGPDCPHGQYLGDEDVERIEVKAS